MMDPAPSASYPAARGVPASDLICPACRKPLHPTDSDRLRCEGGHAYPIVDGVPDLLPEEGLHRRPADLPPTVDLTIIVPAWNEANNLTALLPRVKATLDRLRISHEILVIDAGSLDGTAEVATAAGARVARQSEAGYGGALREGFALARGRHIATLDADLSHDPDFLETMWMAREQAGVVIASRYVPGGKADMPVYRRLFSRLLNRVYARGLSLNFRDMSSGFRLYRVDLLRGLEINGRNFDVLEDILLSLVSAGHEVIEVPLHHKARLTGRSHVRLLQFVLSYLRTFGRLWRLRHSAEAADHEARAASTPNPLRRWRLRQRRDVLTAAAAEGGSTLYVGCASDPLLSSLPDATGADQRLNKLRWARRFGRPVVRCSAAALPFRDNRFDTVIWSDFRDPLGDGGRHLDELIRVVAPGGRLAIETRRGLAKELRSALERRGLAAEPTRALGSVSIVVARRAGVTSAGAAPRIGLGLANISALQREYVNDVLRKNRLSYGEYTRRFEKEFARLHERRFAIFCNSGTSALQVALHALKELHGWQDGDEVLVPAVTFVASANVVLQNRLRPVFVDVEADHFGIDPAQLERHRSPRTRAVMPVHLFGQPCDMDPILAFAARHGLRILEDSCETMFVRYKGRPAGSWGDAACFSSYVAHLIVTGVGGLAATNDEGLATLIKSLMNHGRDHIYLSIDDDNTDDPDALREIVSRRFAFVHLGYSYRATEMEAALGVGELARHQEILRRRQENARYLNQRLRHLSDLQLPSQRKDTEHAYMLYPLVARDGIDREALLLHLERAGIETRHLMPLINQPIYRKLFGDLEPHYPVAARLNRLGFAIGCHQGLGREDLDYIVHAFESYFAI